MAQARMDAVAESQRQVAAAEKADRERAAADARSAPPAPTETVTVAEDTPPPKPAEADPAMSVTDAEYARSPTLSLFDHLPRDCDDSRMVIRLGAILKGDAGTQVDGFVKKSAGVSKTEKSKKLSQKLASSGASSHWFSDVVVCGRKTSNRTVVVIGLDLPTKKKPADLIGDLLAGMRSEPPEREDHGPVSLFLPRSSSGGGVFATVGDSALIIGDKRPIVDQAIVGHANETFAESAGKVVWIRSFGRDPIELDVVESGDGYDLRGRVRFGAADAKSMNGEFQSFLQKLSSLEKKVPPLAPLDSAIRHARVEVQGDALVGSAHVSRAAFVAALRAGQNLSPKDLDEIF